MSNLHLRTNRVILWSIIGAALYTACFAAIYFFMPFDVIFRPGLELTWNDFSTNLMTVIPAVLCAVLATTIWKYHQREQPGTAIWGYFACGLWLWSLAEVLWMIYNMTIVEVPGVSIIDIPWVAAYVLFSLSLERQYRTLHRNSRARRIVGFTGVWAGILLGAYLLTLLVNGPGWSTEAAETYLSFFYVLGDLAIAVMSLILIRTFRGGAMLRPWLGLFVFAFADGLYAWLYESGLYTYSTAEGNLSSTLADTTYTVAYLVLAVALLAHLLLVKYGARSLWPRKVKSA